MSGGADLVARLRLEANAGNTSAVIGGARREVEALAPAGTKAAGGLRQAEAASASAQRSFSSTGAAATALGAVLGGIGLKEFAGRIKDTAFEFQGLQTGLEAVTGGSQGAAEAQAYVREQSERLGLVIKDQTNSYLKLAAATNGTALQGKATQEIWLGLVQAGTALNLTADKQANAMLAISQIASKGVVQQEDLRGQLAEALPGALQVAQRALGKTEQEFNKLVASGALLASDFLPKLAGQLNKEFGPKIDEALTKPLGQARVELGKWENVTQGLEAVAGESFLIGLTSGVRSLNAELKDASAQEAARALGQVLGEGLALAAQGAAFLVDHLDQVQIAATAVVGVGLAKWLISSAAEARTAAAAYLAKGVAARDAGAIAVTTAQGETVAVTTLRGAIEATARAELAAAAAARENAIADETAAAAALTRARAEASATTGGLLLAENRGKIALAERELALAQDATAAASARAEAATVSLTKVTTLGGAAAQGAKTLFSGLMALVGGPLGVAFLAAGAAAGAFTSYLAANERAEQQAKSAAEGHTQAMADLVRYLGPAATASALFGSQSQDAVKGVNALAGATGGLADQTARYASAKAEAMRLSLEGDILKQQEVVNASSKHMSAAGDMVPGINSTIHGVLAVAERAWNAMGGTADWSGDNAALVNAAVARARIAQAKAGLEALKSNPGSYKPDAPSIPSATVTGKADKAELKAEDRLKDLAAMTAAEEKHTAALIAGGAQLDQYRIEEAGRQAVERLALADRPKLTAAEAALVAKIKEGAEAAERAKIANERLEKSVGLQKSAEADTKALRDRAVAAVAGEAALEALQVKEAGLAALQQIGVDSLDQLTGKTLEHAKAAIAAAEAKEREEIATAKVERVAAQIRDLEQRTRSEEGYARAVAGGTETLVAYQRAEFVRQEIERAGKALTDDQVAAIRAKAEALFAVQAAADSAALDQRQAEELRLARLTNDQRAIEERYLERQTLIRRQHLDWTKEEVDARARALALADEAAAQDAKAIGDLKQGLEDAFVESGKLGFDDVGDYVEQRLREAVYNALLAKPIDILINAVVGSFSSASVTGAGGGLGSLGGASGLLSMFNSAGALKGLTSTATDLSAQVLGKLGISNAGLAGGIGSAVGGAGTGALVSGLASVLGLKQSSGNQIGSSIGGAIGSFIPIPGGAILGSIAGNLIGGLVGGKESNHAAVLGLDASGQVTSVGGGKRTDETTAAANQIAQAVAQIQAALVAGGATLTKTVSSIDIGTRDSTHLGFSDGTSIDTAVGDVAAAIQAASKAILDNAKFGSEAATAYAQKLLAAGATVDQVVATLQVAGSFGGSIDDAIAQLTDPAAYAKKQALDAIDANYQALKKQAQELIDAGLATEGVLTKIDQLKDLQVDEALKRLGDAATNTAAAIDPIAFKGSIQDQIAQLLDPVAFARAQALAGIDDNIAALKAQAEQLIADGKLSADVLGQIDQLKTLQVAESVAKLGDAASDAAKALKDAADKAAAEAAARAQAQQAANDFATGIDDAILQLTDPIQARVVAIQRDYEAKVAQAQAMIAAGQLGVGVLDQLASLRDLQIDDVLKDLADNAGEAIDVFAQARPRLQAWLDGLATGSNSPLSAAAQKAEAQAVYNRLLAQAQAGDADALSQLTGAADQLLGADRNATSSAADRLALYNKVQADIQGLTARGAVVGQDPKLVEAKKTTELLTKIKEGLDPAEIAKRPAAPVEVKASPWIEQQQKLAAEARDKALKDGVDRLAAKADEGRAATVEGLGKVEAALASGLAAMAGAVASSQAAAAAKIDGLADQIARLSSAQELSNTYMRKAVS